MLNKVKQLFKLILGKLKQIVSYAIGKLKQIVSYYAMPFLFFISMFVGYYIVEHTFITHAVVEGRSMQPTYYDNDTLIFGNKVEPKRGEVAIFKMDNTYIIKRVIGIPGDTIKIDDSRVYVNGVELEEDYIFEDTFSGYDYEGTSITLASDEYFIMGDNRNNSLDSRKRGPFKDTQLIGTVLFHKTQKYDLK